MRGELAGPPRAAAGQRQLLAAEDRVGRAVLADQLEDQGGVARVVGETGAAAGGRRRHRRAAAEQRHGTTAVRLVARVLGGDERARERSERAVDVARQWLRTST